MKKNFVCHRVTVSWMCLKCVPSSSFDDFSVKHLFVFLSLFIIFVGKMFDKVSSKTHSDILLIVRSPVGLSMITLVKLTLYVKMEREER